MGRENFEGLWVIHTSNLQNPAWLPLFGSFCKTIVWPPAPLRVGCDGGRPPHETLGRGCARPLTSVSESSNCENGSPPPNPQLTGVFETRRTGGGGSSWLLRGGVQLAPAGGGGGSSWLLRGGGGVQLAPAGGGGVQLAPAGGGGASGSFRRQRKERGQEGTRWAMSGEDGPLRPPEPHKIDTRPSPPPPAWGLCDDRIPGTDQAVRGGRHGLKLHSGFPPPTQAGGCPQ